VSGSENEQIVRDIYERFGRGELDAILTLLTDDVEWIVAPCADVPFSGVHRGPQQVRAFFHNLAYFARFERFEPRETHVAGEAVFVLGRERAFSKPKDRVWECDWIHVWKLRGGKVACFREYTDTAAIAQAFV
jgi:hypothetical protein